MVELWNSFTLKANQLLAVASYLPHSLNLLMLPLSKKVNMHTLFPQNIKLLKKTIVALYLV